MAVLMAFLPRRPKSEMGKRKGNRSVTAAVKVKRGKEMQKVKRV